MQLTACQYSYLPLDEFGLTMRDVDTLRELGVRWELPIIESDDQFLKACGVIPLESE